MHNGAAVAILREEVQATIDSAAAYPELADYSAQLTATLDQVEQTITAVVACDDNSLALANATIFLDAMGHAVIAWMWLIQAVAASAGKAKGESTDRDFYAGKLAATNFFFRYELPKAKASLELVADLDSTCYDLTAEQFLGQ